MRIAIALASAVFARSPLQAQQAGQALYQSNCAGCHGLDGRGGEHAPDIATVQRVQQLTERDLFRIIRDGVPASGMPAFGSRLNREQLSTVSGYLRSLQGERRTAPLPGNPARGRDLFFKQAGCSECHMAGGEGGFIAGDLSSHSRGHSIEQIRESILNPNNNLDPPHPLATVVTKNGQQYTGVIRNEDNFSLQLEGRDGVFHLLDKVTLVSIKREKRSFMPANYGSKLSPADVNDLISFLMQIAASQPKQTEDNSEW